MILTCPECSTRYLTKDDAIGPNGRTVRCAKCETTWFVAQDLDELTLKDNEVEAIVPATVGGTAAAKDAQADFGTTGDEGVTNPLFQAAGAHEKHRDKVDNERRRRRLKSVALIWIIPLLILFIAAILAYVFRQDIVNKFPASATIYKSIGMDVTLSGLSIEDPITRSALVDGKPVLVVNGAVRNISTETQAVPLIELSLHSKSGEALATWLVDVNTPRLGKEARVTFASEYPNPPVDAVNLRYRFADETAVMTQDDTSGVAPIAPLETIMKAQ